MVSVSKRDVALVSIAAVLSAILYRYWLITPVLDHFSINQWRAVAIGVAALGGSLRGLAKWNLSTLVSGFMVGELAGGTWVALPASHASLGDAFKSNLESLGGEMIAFIFAVTLGGYCSSRFAKSRRQL